MSLLAQCRLSPRWLVLLVALAALAVTTAALVPHDDGKFEDQGCLVCKAGHQPLTQLTVELVSEPPVDFTSTTAPLIVRPSRRRRSRIRRAASTSGLTPSPNVACSS